MKKEVINADNLKVINAFLDNLKNNGRRSCTIEDYKGVLTNFFRRREVLFSSLTPSDIQGWLTEQKKGRKKKTIQKYNRALCFFFQFCVEKGLIENAPIRKENYWEIRGSLPNLETQKVINEFLLSLKNSNKNKKVIVHYRKSLQSFFKEREAPFCSLTSQDIKRWLNSKQKGWNKTTIKNWLYNLRFFYHFCLGKGYVESNPIQYQREKEENYWEVKESFENNVNKEAVNEFLVSLRVANCSKHTIVNYRYFLQSFFKERKEVYSNLTSDIILEWINEHQKSLKEKTISFHLNVLKSFFAYCIEEGYLEKSPIKSRWFPYLPKPVPKYLEKLEVAKVRKQGENEGLRDRVLVEFLLSSGCRIGEVHRLNRKDVDFEKRTALVFGKGKKYRQVHFSEKCFFLLERYLQSRVDDHPALFVSNRKINNRLSITWMRKILRRLGEKANISSTLYPHRFRHTFATELMGKGAALSFIGDELGHSNLKTTLVYANIPKGEIISMYRKYLG